MIGPQSTPATSFLDDSARMLGWRGVAVLIGGCTAILLARWLGPEDRGTLAVYVLSVGLAALVLQMGVPETLIYAIGSRAQPVREVVATALASCLVVGSAAGLATHLALTLVWGLPPTTSAALACAIPVTMTLSTARHVLLGLKRFNSYSLTTILEVGSYLSAAAALRVAGALAVETVLLAYVLSLLVGVAWALSMLRRAGVLSVSWRDVRPRAVGGWVRRGLHMFLVGVGSFAADRINYFVLDTVMGSRAVGLFAAASTLPRLIANLPEQIAITLYSHVSNRVSNEEAVRATTAIAGLLLAVFVLMLPPLWFLAEPLVGLLFGAEFAGVGEIMVVLTLSTMVAGLGSLLFNSLAGAGRHDIGGRLTVVSVSVLALAAVLLVPVYGLYGAACSQLLANALRLGYLAVLFGRHSGLPLTSLFAPSRGAFAALGRGARLAAGPGARPPDAPAPGTGPGPILRHTGGGLTNGKLLPNLIICGVYKCGTTSLFEYLSAHPGVCGSSLKQVSGWEGGVPPFDRYRRYFTHHRGQRWLLEAAPTYFSRREVAEGIRRHIEGARILVVLRDPAARLYSNYKYEQSLFNVSDTVPFLDFVQASERLPPHFRDASGGIDEGFYVKHLRHWFEFFDRDLKVIFFEHLEANPRRVVGGICDWLGIDASFYAGRDFPVANRSTRPRSLRVHRVVRTVIRTADRASFLHPVAYARVRRFVQEKYVALNTVPNVSLPPPDAKAYVDAIYRPWNQALDGELRLHGYSDLPGWVGR